MQLIQILQRIYVNKTISPKAFVLGLFLYGRMNIQKWGSINIRISNLTLKSMHGKILEQNIALLA